LSVGPSRQHWMNDLKLFDWGLTGPTAPIDCSFDFHFDENDDMDADVDFAAEMIVCRMVVVPADATSEVDHLAIRLGETTILGEEDDVVQMVERLDSHEVHSSLDFGTTAPNPCCDRHVPYQNQAVALFLSNLAMILAVAHATAEACQRLDHERSYCGHVWAVNRLL
jgi:hypothetical protein